MYSLPNNGQMQIKNIEYRFALFTIRPLVARFELTERP